jgi:hypothetical protein
MAVIEMGELEVVPSLKVPMGDELETEILSHDPPRVVFGMNNWPSAIG